MGRFLLSVGHDDDRASALGWARAAAAAGGYGIEIRQLGD